MQMMSLEKEAAMETKTAEQRSLDYRNAMARLGAAVNIVTTDGAAAELALQRRPFAAFPTIRPRFSSASTAMPQPTRW